MFAAWHPVMALCILDENSLRYLAQHLAATMPIITILANRIVTESARRQLRLSPRDDPIILSAILFRWTFRSRLTKDRKQLNVWDEKRNIQLL